MALDEVMRWVARYEQAWRDRDPKGVEELFSPDAIYLRSPYEEPDIGHEAIKAFWCDDDDDAFRMQASPVAVEDRSAVIRVEVHYGDPVRQEYRDLWVLTFDDDARVSRFEEWPFFPGQPYAPREPPD